MAAAETEVAETTPSAEESTEAADKAETTAETEQEPAASENSSRGIHKRKLNPPLAKKVIFVLIMVLMFVAPVLLSLSCW